MNNEDKEKSQHSKNAIISFFVFGIILFFIFKEPLNPLSTTLFFLIGMFAISILSIPSFLLKMYIAKKFFIGQTLKLKKIYWIFELLYNFIITFLLFKIFLTIY